MSKVRFKDTKIANWFKTNAPQALDFIGDVLPNSGVWGIAKNLIDFSSASKEEKEKAHKLLIDDMQLLDRQVTERHSNDMISDSWASKNIRPFTLAYLIVFTSILIVLDSSITAFSVNNAWVSLLLALLSTAFVFYFGGRTIEKVKSFTK